MRKPRVETRARARALQALYAWDMRNGAATSPSAAVATQLPRVAARVWDDLAIAPEERGVAEPLVNTVAAHAPAIDAGLEAVTTNWRLSRLGAIERSVLRLAAAELTLGRTPPRVVIQEAVHLAERFGTATSARFVNGVLDALARRMGRL
jgi:transcription antitermination protein NusB